MRTHLSTLLLCLLGLGLLACQSDQAQLGEHLTRGEEYMEAESWPEAIIEYKRVLQIDPNHGAAHFQLSQAYLQEGKTAEAYWELRETMRLDPGNREATLQFAQLSVLAGNPEEGLEAAQKLAADEPSKADGHLIVAQAHATLNRPEDARAAYERAIEVEPDNSGARLLFASFLRTSGDREEAERHFKHAAEIDPTPLSQLAYGGFLAEDGRDDQALALFRRATEVADEQSSIVQAYQVLGTHLYQLDRVEEGEAVFEEGFERAEDPTELMYQLGRIYRERGEWGKADAIAVRASEARPDDPAPLLVLSTYRSQQGDPHGALDAAEKALALAGPEDNAARLRVAELALEIGFVEGNEEEVERGRQIVTEILAAEPENSAALFVKAKLDLAERRTEQAIEGLRIVLDSEPDWGKAHFLLGTALNVSGERTGARAALARALELDASLVDVRRVLAEVHAALGEHEYAVDEGRRYLRAHPAHLATRIRVAQSLVMLGRWKDALAEVESIPEEDRTGHVNFAIGRLHMYRNDFEQSRPYMERALEQMPANPDILLSLLQMDASKRQIDESIKRINAAVQENPKDAPLARLQGKLAMVRGLAKDAEEAFQRSIDLAPEQIEGYRELADLYILTGRTAESIQTFERSLEVRPDQPQIHHLLAVLYEHGGDQEKAIEHYQAAIRYEPNLGEAKNNLAYLLAEKGEELDLALELAQEAKALMPDNANTADTLGWVLYKRGVPSAAIGYLKEAVAGTPPDDRNLGLLRFHLAQAYEAAGDQDNAKKSVAQAIADDETYRRNAGSDAGETPSWVADAQKMQERL